MYKCLNRNTFADKEGYQLVPIRQEDVENIRVWRNVQKDVLRQKHEISAHEQQTYFRQILVPTFSQAQPKQILFSFLLHKTCIGYGGLTHIDWESLRGEVSFLVDPLRAEQESQYTQDYSHFLALLCQAAFEELNLHRLFAETFAFRTHHLTILEKFGFQLEGVLREHVYKQEKWYNSILHGLLAVEWEEHA